MIFRKSTALLAMITAGTASILPAPALARHHYYDNYEQKRDYSYGYGSGNYGYFERRGYDRSAYDADYYDRTYYGGDHRAYRHHRCRRDGTTGALIGAIAGGLIGNGVAGRGDGTLGALIGGGAGALLGREVGRSNAGC